MCNYQNLNVMKNIKKLFYVAIAIGIIGLPSCQEDDNGNPIPSPMANAGNDQTVDLEKTVLLDGSASSGDNVTYAWTLNDPAGNEVVLQDASTPSPSFQATVPGTYVATLVIANNGGSNTSTTAIEVVNPTYQLADQMGRPGINTVFNFFGSSDIKNAFNKVLPSEGAANTMDFKGIFDALQSYIGLDPGTYNNVLGLDNMTTASVLATDVLMSNKTAPSTYGPSDLNNIILGQNVLNGRGLADDVIDVTLILAFAGNDLGAINSTQMGLISDNVSENDKAFLNTFPYLATPH